MTDLERAWSELSKNDAWTCALVRDRVIYHSERKGIAPMMDLLNAETDLQGFSVADRVVGRAAAMLFVLAGIAAVHAQVMSSDHIDLLPVPGFTLQ